MRPLPFLERSRCWPDSVINLPFLQLPGFESYSHWSDILPATFLEAPARSDHGAPLDNMSPLPGSEPVGGPWSQEVHTPDMILGSPSTAEPWTGPSDWWSEMEICDGCPDQVGSPGVVSVRIQHRLIFHRGPAEPERYPG
jgi:hypothetical protein